MAGTEPLDRRRLLRVGGGGALALALGVAAGWADRRDGGSASPATTPAPGTAPPPSTTTTRPSPLVVAELGEVDPRLVTVGRRVIEVTGEADLGSLVAALPSPDGDPVETAARVVAEEFASGTTVLIDGWVLAASEARATAVIALLCDATAC